MKLNETEIKAFGQAIQKLIGRQSLSEVETYNRFAEILRNRQPDLQQGAFLAALVAKGETAEEIVGAWRAIQEFDTTLASGPLPAVRCENSGTGMDTLKTFNVSSAAAIVAAACGVPMARHGARALTSFCGTVDILESVGVDVECDVETVSGSIRTAGIGLYNGMSGKVHPAALGRILSQIRFGSTLNIAASLANPARPTHAVRGVYAEALLPLLAEVMPRMGYVRGLVVHGQDRHHPGGMDELSITGPTLIREFTAGSAGQSYQVHPGDFGLQPAAFRDIAATGDRVTERRRFLRVLSGRDAGACADFTAINSAAVLFAAGRAGSLLQGLSISREALGSGAALAKLQHWTRVQTSTPGHGESTLDHALRDAGLGDCRI
ncbi:MAG: anthranilate phosphoribosyltransferase [bacterium]